MKIPGLNAERSSIRVVELLDNSFSVPVTILRKVKSGDFGPIINTVVYSFPFDLAVI